MPAVFDNVPVGKARAIGRRRPDRRHARQHHLPAMRMPGNRQRNPLRHFGEDVGLMHEQDQQYTFTGRPVSAIGENITLTMPIGAILREVAASTFRSYFMYGTVFTDKLVPDLGYTVAIEPEIRDFAYRYDRQVEGDVFDIRPGSDTGDAQPLSTITPSIRFTLALTVYDAGNKVLLRKTYESGWVAGEKYIVTSRPHERVNATFHKALQATMEKVAADIRPFFAEDEVER